LPHQDLQQIVGTAPSIPHPYRPVVTPRHICFSAKGAGVIIDKSEWRRKRLFTRRVTMSVTTRTGSVMEDIRCGSSRRQVVCASPWRSSWGGRGEGQRIRRTRDPQQRDRTDRDWWDSKDRRDGRGRQSGSTCRRLPQRESRQGREKKERQIVGEATRSLVLRSTIAPDLRSEWRQKASEFEPLRSK